MEVGEKVYIVTDVELGWNCICGVFGSFRSLVLYFFQDNLEEEVDEMLSVGYNMADLEKYIDDCYVIHEEYIE